MLVGRDSIISFDFSGTFNTVQTLWEGNKLIEMQMDALMVSTDEGLSHQ